MERRLPVLMFIGKVPKVPNCKTAMKGITSRTVDEF